MSVDRVRGESLKLLSRKFNSKEGVVKINVGNTFRHELAKFLVCWDLALNGKHFVCEAVFENGKRADVLCLDDKEVLEILESETEEQFKLKVESYPCPAFGFKAVDILLKARGLL